MEYFSTFEGLKDLVQESTYNWCKENLEDWEWSLVVKTSPNHHNMVAVYVDRWKRDDSSHETIGWEMLSCGVSYQQSLEAQLRSIDVTQRIISVFSKPAQWHLVNGFFTTDIVPFLNLLKSDD